jgi:hypothetical protein
MFHCPCAEGLAPDEAILTAGVGGEDGSRGGRFCAPAALGKFILARAVKKPPRRRRLFDPVRMNNRRFLKDVIKYA